jgi:hypothetical protein
MSPPSSSVPQGLFESGIFDPLHTLSPQELSDVVSKSDVYDTLERRLHAQSYVAATLRSFTFLSDSISTLEEQLERQQVERELLYNILDTNLHFRQTFRPMLVDHRQRLLKRPKRVRLQTPYSRPHPGPFITNVSSQGIERNTYTVRYPKSSPIASTSALPDESSSDGSSSYHSAGSGSHDDPIYIHDDDENTCARCFGHGHLYEDCDAQIRTFVDCSACEWNKIKGKDKGHCTHYDITPAWAKRQRARLDLAK